MGTRFGVGVGVVAVEEGYEMVESAFGDSLSVCFCACFLLSVRVCVILVCHRPGFPLSNPRVCNVRRLATHACKPNQPTLLKFCISSQRGQMGQNLCSTFFKSLHPVIVIIAGEANGKPVGGSLSFANLTKR